jgi:hypothetical protein
MKPQSVSTAIVCQHCAEIKTETKLKATGCSKTPVNRILETNGVLSTNTVVFSVTTVDA